MARLTAFRRSKRANVAMIFALSAIPVVIAVGGGVDLARSMVVRSNWPVRWMRRVSRWGPHPGSLRRRWRRSRSNIYFKLHECNIFGVPGPVSVGTGIVGPAL